jgi:multidrug efflux pump subunit AcrB
MLYMSSTCSNNGSYSLSVTFEVGTDPNIAQVNVQNRVQQAVPKLPTEVNDQGVSVRTRSSDILGVITFFAEDGTSDALFLSNYVSINVKDALTRLRGVSEAYIFGALDYSMRIWMDPERLTSLGLTADDVITAIRQQNVQAATGSIGTAPTSDTQQVQYTLRARGRLNQAGDFENIVIRTNQQGGILRLKDVARVELGAQTYASKSIFDGSPAVNMAIYRTSGANALETVKAVEVRTETDFPTLSQRGSISAQLRHHTVCSVRHFRNHSDPFDHISAGGGGDVSFSSGLARHLIPTLTIPVSLVGCFAVLLVLGFSANTLTLFALILAIGLVVDDAIVVVENVQRVMEEEGLAPKEAAVKAMGQVTAPIISTTLVMLAVFVPVGFIPGITGQLYRQFAVTISTSVVLSSVCALTLSPALCATLLKSASTHQTRTPGLVQPSSGRFSKRLCGHGRLADQKRGSCSSLFVILAGGPGSCSTTGPPAFCPMKTRGSFSSTRNCPRLPPWPAPTR